MKKLFLLFVTVFLTILLFTGCKWLFPPETPTLPLETQTGEHTFGCYIDGELFLKNNKPIFLGDWLGARYVSTDDGLIYPKGIKIWCEGRNGKVIEMFFNNFTIGSDIVMDKVSYAGVENCDVSYVHLTKLDTINRIISGRFEFNLIDSVNNKTVRFTEGRFDIRNMSK